MAERTVTLQLSFDKVWVPVVRLHSPLPVCGHSWAATAHGHMVVPSHH